MKVNFLIYQGILAVLLSILLVSCKKESPKELPTVTIDAVTAISDNAAVCGGNITSNGNSEITARGVCWSTYQNPTIVDFKTADGTGGSIFTSLIVQLNPGVTYYVRAYATNSAGTAYSAQTSFSTLAAVPVITTSDVTDVSNSTANCGGNITHDGGASITARGVCWSKNKIPMITDNKTSDGIGTGSFQSSIINMDPSTQYYVRAYATNNAGTGYGMIYSFKTKVEIKFNPNLNYGTTADIDGNIYKTITIGTQTWMAQNLRTTHYRNGEPIIQIIDGRGWYNTTSSAYCNYWNINNDDTIAMIGRLYNAYSISDSRQIAPTGWHISTRAEWETLINFLGGMSAARLKLKESGTTHWGAPNTGATNESGFTALPGGFRVGDQFMNLGCEGVWCFSDLGSGNLITGYFLKLSFIENYIGIYPGQDYSDGYSVRCVKD